MAPKYSPDNGPPDEFLLPAPKHDGEVSVEKALRKRRSAREYTEKPLRLKEVSQLLWAAQGITGPNGERTAASAGALYPLEVYLVAGNVAEIPSGVYKYQPRIHALAGVTSGDKRVNLAAASLDQRCVEDGAVVIVIAAVYERTTKDYGRRGEMYVHQEVGHAAQNIQLQAVALGLGSVVVGAFDEVKIQNILNMPGRELPLYIIPVGRIK